MPFNLLKVYNDLLELDHLNELQRNDSLKGIFNRDIKDNPEFTFKEKKILPTSDDEIGVAILFEHLTNKKAGKAKIYDSHRSKRLHWINFHLEERKPDKIIAFSVIESKGTRTYIFDETEKYVIVLDCINKMTEYYLLTAHYLDDKNVKKIKNKISRW